MKKLIISIIFLVIIYCSSAFSVYQFKPEYQLIYNANISARFDFSDLNLYDNINTYYVGRGFPLPRYIPQYLELDMYATNKSALEHRAWGMYTPRCFDGEQFTNFRIDAFNPRDLSDTERALLDEQSLVISPMKDTENKCNYVAYWQNTKDFSSGYTTNNKTLYSVNYYYDLGYWYVPEIRSAFQDDCHYIFKNITSVHHVTGNHYQFFYQNNDLGFVIEDTYAESLCDQQQEQGILPRWKIQFKASSQVDLSVKLYTYLLNNDKSKIHADGTCTLHDNVDGENYLVDCYSLERVIIDTKAKDDWMVKVKNGGYIPLSRRVNGLTIDEYLVKTDERYKDCAQYIALSYSSNNYVTMVLKIGFNIYSYFYPNNEAKQCDDYLQERRKTLLKETEDWTKIGVDNMIWKHYQDYDIPKGTNLYPFNIDFAGIRCHENVSWTGYNVNPISPNVETPSIVCNYTDKDPEVIKVGWDFEIINNPAFQMVSGSDSILHSYDSDFWKTMFSAFNAYGKELNITISNYSGGVILTAYFLMNRSKEDGCTFVYLDNATAKAITDGLIGAGDDLNNGADTIPTEAKAQALTQLKLLKSEVQQTRFYFYVDTIAQLIFRVFVMFFYAIEIVLFIYALRMIFLVPSVMLNLLKNIGRSKHQLEKNSMMNR